MSFKLTLEQMNNPHLFNSLQHLLQQQMGAKAAWNISRLNKQLDKAMKEGRESYIKGLKQFVELDDDGEIKCAVVKSDEEGKNMGLKKGDPINGSYTIIEEKKKIFDAWVAEYMQIEITIESYKIHMDDLADIQVSPQILLNLDDIVMSKEDALEHIKKENAENVEEIRPH